MSTSFSTETISDASVQRAIDLYSRALPPGELKMFELSACDRVGVPCQSATFFDPAGRMRGGVGYGASRAAALVGALGEMTEEFCASRAVQERQARGPIIGSYREMVHVRGRRGVADPLTLCLEAGSDYSPEMPLSWYEVERWPLGERVLVPLEWVACYAGDMSGAPNKARPLITPITNGLGAGLSFEQALCHGLLELLQRDGNSVRFRALARGLAVDLDSIHDPQSRAVLNALQSAGVQVRVKIASTEMGLANVYVVGADREDVADAPSIMALGCGEACHPVAQVAVRKALLEFCASRSRLAFFHGPLGLAARAAPEGYLERVIPTLDAAGEEPRALKSMRRWIEMTLGEIKSLLGERVLRVDESVDFTILPTEDEAGLWDKKKLLQVLGGALEAQGLEVLVADFSPPDKSVCALKVIVPGLEVETMSYARIGERNLSRLIENAHAGDVELAGIGAAPAGAKPILLSDEARERVGGAAWLDVEGVARVLGPLYSLYREPGRHIAPWLAGRSVRPST